MKALVRSTRISPYRRAIGVIAVAALIVLWTAMASNLFRFVTGGAGALP
jgi:hypothetical protein